MSYSTIIYAVDLDTVRGAVGSCDEGILEAINGKFLDQSSSESGRTLRIEVNDDASLFLDGKPASTEDFTEEMRKLTNPDDNIRFHPSQSEAGKKLHRLIFDTWQEMQTKNGIAPNLLTVARENIWEDDDDSLAFESSEIENAIRSLVFGKLNEHTASDYLYAFEYLCKYYGELLEDGESVGDLRQLDLNLSLENWRCPIAIDQSDGFPFVSFLTPTEVVAEFSRLNQLDLSFPEDEDIAYAREVILKCLREASEKRNSLMVYYY